MTAIISQPLNPQYVYVQASTPSDLTEGKLWYNTTDNFTYVSDGSAYNLVATIQTPQRKIYEGTDLNIDISASATTTAQSTELEACSLTTFDNIEIVLNGLAELSAYYNVSGTYTSMSVKYQIKEIGGEYADIKAYEEVGKQYTEIDSGGCKTRVTNNINYTIIETLTAGMKANGYQVKVFVQLINTNAGSYVCRFVLNQTFLREF